MSTFGNWLKGIFTKISRPDEEPVPDTIRACDWEPLISGMKVIDPALVAALESFLDRLQHSVDSSKVPVYARLLLQASCFKPEQPFLKVAVFPAWRDTDYQKLESIVRKAALKSPAIAFDDYDIGECASCDIVASGSRRKLRIMIPAGDWTDGSLPTRVRNEENPQEQEYSQKPFRYAILPIKPASPAAK